MQVSIKSASSTRRKRLKRASTKSVTNYARYRSSMMQNALALNLSQGGTLNDTTQVIYWDGWRLDEQVVTDTNLAAYVNIFKYYRMKKVHVTWTAIVPSFRTSDTVADEFSSGGMFILPIHDVSQLRILNPIFNKESLYNLPGLFSGVPGVEYWRTQKHAKVKNTVASVGFKSNAMSLSITPSVFDTIAALPEIGEAAAPTFQYKARFRQWFETYDADSDGAPIYSQIEHYGYVFGLFNWVTGSSVENMPRFRVDRKIYWEFKEHKPTGGTFPIPELIGDLEEVKVAGGMILVRNKNIVEVKE